MTKILNQLKAHPNVWKSTAVFVTVDEGGGYWDSGYIQPLDFFGHGTRIPLIVVSPYSKGVGVVHSYSDHVSTAKFIEANWSLPAIYTAGPSGSEKGRDTFPNPKAKSGNPYVPTNSPAIDDLMDMFNFTTK